MEQLPQAEPKAEQVTRQIFKTYLNPIVIREGEKPQLYFRKGNQAHGEIAELMLNDKNRTIFTEEWAQAIGAAATPEVFTATMALGWDPHQQEQLRTQLESRLRKINPHAKDNWKDPVNYDYDYPSQLLPEYDIVRQALAKKAQEGKDWLSLVRENNGVLISTKYRKETVPDDQFIAELLRSRQSPIPELTIQPPKDPNSPSPTETAGDPDSDKEKDLQELKRSINTLLSNKIGRAVINSSGERIAYLYFASGLREDSTGFGISEDGVIFTINSLAGTVQEMQDHEAFVRSTDEWKINLPLTPKAFRDFVNDRHQTVAPISFSDRSDSEDPQSAQRAINYWKETIRDMLRTDFETAKSRGQEMINKRVAENLKPVVSDLKTMIGE